MRAQILRRYQANAVRFSGRYTYSQPGQQASRITGLILLWDAGGEPRPAACVADEEHGAVAVSRWHGSSVVDFEVAVGRRRTPTVAVLRNVKGPGAASQISVANTNWSVAHLHCCRHPTPAPSFDLDVPVRLHLGFQLPYHPIWPAVGLRTMFRFTTRLSPQSPRRSRRE
jgi:hypothetical protein